MYICIYIYIYAVFKVYQSIDPGYCQHHTHTGPTKAFFCSNKSRKISTNCPLLRNTSKYSGKNTLPTKCSFHDLPRLVLLGCLEKLTVCFEENSTVPRVGCPCHLGMQSPGWISWTRTLTHRMLTPTQLPLFVYNLDTQECENMWKSKGLRPHLLLFGKSAQKCQTA